MTSTSLRGTKGLDDYALASAREVPGSSLPGVMAEMDLVIEDRYLFKIYLLRGCTLYPVMGTTPYASGWSFHPLVLFELDSGRYNLSSEPSAFRWEPVALRDVQLVGCPQRGWEPVEQCTGWYESETDIPIDMRREGSWARLRVIAAYSGKVIGEWLFRGPDPGPFPSPAKYRTFQPCSMLSEYTACLTQVDSIPVFPQRILGAKVPIKEVMEALRPFVEGE